MPEDEIIDPIETGPETPAPEPEVEAAPDPEPEVTRADLDRLRQDVARSVKRLNRAIKEQRGDREPAPTPDEPEPAPTPEPASASSAPKTGGMGYIGGLLGGVRRKR